MNDHSPDQAGSSHDPDAMALEVARTLIRLEGTAKAWDLTLEEARVGYSRVQMMARPDMLNGHGSVHGGMIFALADTAFAYACNARNISTVAQQASIIFVSPATAGEILIAEAREVTVAGRSGVYAVEVRSRDGRVVAEFQGLSRAVGGPVVIEKDEM